nr:MAG TPA: hypothetical protein [Caudoviricetes sp.]
MFSTKSACVARTLAEGTIIRPVARSGDRAALSKKSPWKQKNHLPSKLFLKNACKNQNKALPLQPLRTTTTTTTTTTKPSTTLSSQIL